MLSKRYLWYTSNIFFLDISIIGGGSAGIFAAALLSTQHKVTLYEKGKRLGRKFLVAGKGGFNLTHAATSNELTQVYRPKGFLDVALQTYDVPCFRQQLQDWGIETFVGSSGRVFPVKGIKPIDVLDAIHQVLLQNEVAIKYFHEFVGFNENIIPLLEYENTRIEAEGERFIFALGGASWSKTGSDGKWTSYFEDIGVPITPFQASNCGLNINWEPQFREKFQGTPLKNIAISIGESRQKGEALITQYGLEGNAVYPIIHEVRSAIQGGKNPIISLDLKPHSTLDALKKKSKSLQPKNYKYAFKLSPVKLALLKQFTDKTTYTQAELFANKLKHLEIPITSLRPMEEAISTVGGIAIPALNKDFSLRQYPHIYLIGEMLDWDAPTGGFLLQACFSMASTLSHSLTSTRHN